MKLFLYFDLEFTYYGHAMATWFKRDFGMLDRDFRGLVVGRNWYDFITRTQQDIRYADLSLYQNLLWRALSEPPDMEFLQKAERELETDTLWRLFDADRSVKGFTHQQALSAMTIFLKYYWQEFTEHRPAAVVAFTCASLSALACYLVARRFGIPWMEMATTRIPRRYVIGDHPTGSRFESVERRYASILASPGSAEELSRARMYLMEYRARPSVPSGLTRQAEITGHQTSIHPRRLVGLLRILYWYYAGPYRRDITVRHPIRQAVAVIRSNFRRRRLLGTGVFERDLPGKERYAYYALQFEPESATMVLAPFYQDQVALVENIARSLPIDMKLYVKEHVPMIGFRALGDYERLRRIPNVRLVHPGLSSLELSRNAQVVLTITGTPGWEALLLGRPVVTFGSIFYDGLDSVIKCHSITDLPTILRSIKLSAGSSSDEQIEAFIAALFAESFEFDGDRLWHPDWPYEKIRDSQEAATIYDGYRRALLERVKV